MLGVFVCLLGLVGVHRGSCLRDTEDQQLHDDEEDPYATALAKLQEEGWALPIPKDAPSFGEEHGCRMDPARTATFTKAFEQEWAASDEADQLRELVRLTTDNFTRVAIVTPFEHRASADWMLETFACHAEKISVRPILVVPDEDTKELVNEHKPLTAVCLANLQGMLSDLYGLEADINLLKWPLALAVMSSGAPGVFSTDIDVIWLANFEEYFSSRPDTDVFVQLDDQAPFLGNPARKTNEMAMKRESHIQFDIEHDVKPECCVGGMNMNAGQVYFKSGPGTRELLASIIDFHFHFVRQTVGYKYCHEDQSPMQWGLFSYCSHGALPSRSSGLHCKLLDPRSFMDLLLADEIWGEPLRTATETYTVHFDADDKRKHMSKRMKAAEDTCYRRGRYEEEEEEKEEE